MTAAVEGQVVSSDQGPQPEEQHVHQDYWGTDETHRWFFPDGEQWVDIKTMNEGDRARFEHMTSTDLMVEQRTQNARIRMDQSRDRHELLKSAIIDWHLYRWDKLHKQQEEIRFTKEKLGTWIDATNPALVDQIHMFIRKHNPWLHGEMTIEQVDEEIDRLRDVRSDLVKREEGKESS